MFTFTEYDNVSFMIKHSVLRHAKIHYITRKKFVCIICSESYLRAHDLKHHVNQIH